MARAEIWYKLHISYSCLWRVVNVLNSNTYRPSELFSKNETKN